MIRWLISRIAIDWDGFAVTRGGFFTCYTPDEYEPWPGGRPPVREPTIVAAGGFCAPMTFRVSSGWDQWRPWRLVRRLRFVDLMITIEAPRGGISYR